MKPDINGLGITAELTLHERALRKAQYEIDDLRAENMRLREELRRLRASREIVAPDPERRILCGEQQWPGRDAFLAWDAEQEAKRTPLQPTPITGVQDSFGGERENPLLAKATPFPPHHSTVGIDGEGRVQG